MRHLLKLSWFAPLLVVACGGSTAGDLFNDAGRGGSAGTGTSGGATSARGGSPSSNGGAASGGASAIGGSMVSGGASALGGTASGGNDVTGGSDVGGSAAGGTGTAGASALGGRNAGGSSAADGGSSGSAAGGTSNHAGGAPGAGGSAAQCEQMRSMLGTLLTEAQRCSLAANAMQCTGFVDSECGCPVPVNNPNSPAAKAYTTAVANYEASCSFACTDVACARPTTAFCSTQGASVQGRCVVFGAVTP